MLIRRNKDVTVIAFPLVQTHERGDGRVVVNDIAWDGVRVFLLDPADERAKGADVFFRRVVVHFRLFSSTSLCE